MVYEKDKAKLADFVRDHIDDPKLAISVGPKCSEGIAVVNKLKQEYVAKGKTLQVSTAQHTEVANVKDTSLPKQ